MGKHYDLKVLNLGAGVQSTCVLLMAIEGEIERPDCAIFADTGWEPSSVYRQLEKLQDVCAKHNLPLHVVSRGNIRKDLLNHIKGYADGGKKWAGVGQPPLYIKNHTEAYRCKVCKDINDLPATTCKCGGDIEMLKVDGGGTLWRQCTREYKIQPVTLKIRELLGYTKRQRIKKRVQQWFGISLDESQRMRMSKDKWCDFYYPLIEKRMDRNNCTKWLQRYGWGDTPKSACVGCPYHSNAIWRDMKNNRPNDWADAVSFDKEIRKYPYPGARGTVYLHRSMAPLENVTLSTAEDKGQLSLLDGMAEECEGMCGV